MKRALVGTVLLLIWAGCRQMAVPPAGSYSEVLVVTEEGKGSALLPLVMKHVDPDLNYYINQERRFEVSVVAASRLPDFPTVKNVLILGVADELTSVGKRIASLLGPQALAKVRAGQATIFKKENMPAPGQLTVIVTATDPARLEEVLTRQGREVAEVIEVSCRRRIRRYLLSYADHELSKRLYRKYGFVIEVPTLYRLFSEEARPPGIELLRDAPPRSLGIFWVDWKREPTLADSLELFRLRANYVWQRYNRDAMDSTRVRFSAAKLGDYPAILMEGYWYNTRATAGGYYRTFFVFEAKEEILWCIDLLVYAPGMAKHPYFRELLALAETFRYD